MAVINVPLKINVSINFTQASADLREVYRRLGKVWELRRYDPHAPVPEAEVSRAE
jgi:hypothetical protein